MSKSKKPARRRPAPEPSGEPGEMKRLGESISGTQPEIGHKDTGVGRRVKEGIRNRRSSPPRRPLSPPNA